VSSKAQNLTRLFCGTMARFWQPGRAGQLILRWGKPEKGDPMKARIPAARFGKPVEVADMILYLASSASDLVNGQDILIDGGYTAV
jgi:NAD(P)-dependent dehydrogenase (short-subunit alcohol dehydrogenase family)